MKSCDHNVVPKDDDPSTGVCTKCGDDTFPIADPAYDAFNILETLREYPNDGVRADFIAYLKEYICIHCGRYFEDGNVRCFCTRDE